LKLHEYQAKQIFRSAEVPVPSGEVCFSGEKAIEVANSIGGRQWIVKAQIHAGGRGKGGGVCLASSINDVKTCAEQILGMNLITHQTGPKGKLVEKILVEEALVIKDELYLAMVVDRGSQKVAVIGSREGGTDIESIASSSPERIETVHIDPTKGLTSEVIEGFRKKLGLPSELENEISRLLERLYSLFIEIDASLVEINPLVVTNEALIVAADAKITIDDNALFRQPELLSIRDTSEEEAAEIAAERAGLNYIALEGNIGCLVNGAGLAMATMDIIQLHGGSPANFLDVGGGATANQVTEAFKIMLGQDGVEVILVNIFGGIMRCDVIATGIVEAVANVNLTLPLVIRLEGTNVEEGKGILAQSGVRFLSAATMDEAAKLAVSSFKG